MISRSVEEVHELLRKSVISQGGIGQERLLAYGVELTLRWLIGDLKTEAVESGLIGVIPGAETPDKPDRQVVRK